MIYTIEQIQRMAEESNAELEHDSYGVTIYKYVKIRGKQRRVWKYFKRINFHYQRVLVTGNIQE